MKWLKDLFKKENFIEEIISRNNYKIVYRDFVGNYVKTDNVVRCVIQRTYESGKIQLRTIENFI